MRLRVPREFCKQNGVGRDWGSIEQRFRAFVVGGIRADRFLDLAVSIKFDGVVVTMDLDGRLLEFNAETKELLSVVDHHFSKRFEAHNAKV